jgi:hypothetical protein
VTPNIIDCPPRIPQRAVRRRAYFPGEGGQPGYGRKEIEPPPGRQLPPPAPSFNREWKSGSDPLPANTEPHAELPPLTVAPEFDGRWRGARPSR